MAIYHLSAKICASRSKGKSSVAAAAYRACDKIEDDRTGLIHDFTRKGGHVYGEVMLCENAPAEYADRAVLWNAVEKEEKAKDAQLAREIEVALPAEYDLSDPMDLESMKDMLRNFIQHTFVDKGMCADWNIHNPGNDMHNPHCHIMLTMRPFKENGEWGAKERKAYKLDENGERIPVIDPATGEQKIGAKNRREWVRETVSTTGWNDRGNIEVWREAWADAVNDYLEKKGIDQLVDHRSFERQGIDRVPTVHEGVARKTWEKELEHDFVADRRTSNVSSEGEPVKAAWTKMDTSRTELNFQIRDINRQVSVWESVMDMCKELIGKIKDKVEYLADRVSKKVKDVFERLTERHKEYIVGAYEGEREAPQGVSKAFLDWKQEQTKLYLDGKGDRAEFVDVDLRGTDFRGYTFRGAIFYKCNLEGVNMRGMDLAHATFDYCKMQEVDFSGADLGEATFYGSDVRYANFDGASLIAAEFRDSQIDGSTFVSADLREVWGNIDWSPMIGDEREAAIAYEDLEEEEDYSSHIDLGL